MVQSKDDDPTCDQDVASPLDALHTVASNPSPENLKALHKLLLNDRRSILVCRHNNVFGIIIDAWRSDARNLDLATNVALVLLLYARLHHRTLEQLGVNALCAETLLDVGASTLAAPIARLWRRVGGPTAKQALQLLERRSSESSALRPLLRKLSARQDVSELRELGAEVVLDRLLESDLSIDAMRLLCRIAQPLEAPQCLRGSVEGEESESNSESSDEDEEESTRQSSKRSNGLHKQHCMEAGVEENSFEAENRRSQEIDSFLAMDHVQSAPVGDVEDCTDYYNDCNVPSAPIHDFRQHLLVDSAEASDWVILYPESGSNELSFHKNFEGGNLRRVRLEQADQLSNQMVLEVLLCGDTNRSAHCQWFFFDVEASRPLELRFHIVTYKADASTFSDGQRIVALGADDRQWRRAGWDYAYFPNRYQIGNRKRNHTLAFSMKVESGRTRIAYFFPYLLGDLLADLRRFRPSSDCLSIVDLGPTPGYRPLLALTITNFSTKPDTPRPHIVVSARVHPGEAPASFMLRGMLEMLLSKSPEAEALRSRYTFVIIPMLNPDGVAEGNGRANLAGKDLNRCWERPSQDSPEVLAAKQLLENLCASPSGVVAFLDLHAHSRRHGAFTLSNPGSEALPDLIATSQASIFDRSQCSFSTNAEKRGSARCVIWRELGVDHAHTVEATYAASSSRKRLVTPRTLSSLGQELLRHCAMLEKGSSQPVTVESNIKSKKKKKKTCGPSFQLVL